MEKKQKIELVEALSNRFKGATALYFTKYTGMNVLQATELRAMFKKKNVDYIVSKNTLAKIAIEKSGLKVELFNDYLLGQIGIAYANEDPTAPAKVIKEFKESNECLEVVGLFFDGEVYESEKYKEFASLPSKEELLTKLASGLNSPMTKVAYCLKSSMTMLANALNDLKNKKN